MELEHQEEEPFIETMVRLQYSPMFRVIVANYGNDEKAIEALNLLHPVNKAESDDLADVISDNTHRIRAMVSLAWWAGRLAERDAVANVEQN